MKKLDLIILTIMFVFSCSSENDAQEQVINLEPCTDNGVFQGDVTLGTQAEVNAFGALCYTGINGNLIIGTSINNDINSLLPLSGINQVNEIHIIDTSLASLEGINLTNQIFLDRIFIFENDNLLTIGNINIPANIGELSIYYNDSLINFNGFNTAEYVGNFILENNNGLVNFEGLDNLTSCGFLFVNENPALINFVGLENCTSIMGESQIGLDVKSNPSLISFDGLENLIYVDDLVINNNVSLNNYCALTNLVANGTIVISNFSPSGCEYNPTQDDMLSGNCSQ